jgi:two-component system nitrate/nitrite response regulator NarL
MNESSSGVIRILLVDDHALFRESLGRLLTAEADFELAGLSDSVEGALRIVAQCVVDIVLLDFDLGERDGGDFVRGASEHDFTGKILLVTAGLKDHDAADLIRRGISGIFMKHSSPSLLVTAIRDVMAGKTWFDQTLLQKALATPALPAPPMARFTDRERQVLRYVLEGLANKEIADKLDVSESSVKSTLQQLFNKAGVRTRGQLVRVALEQYRREF